EMGFTHLGFEAFGDSLSDDDGQYKPASGFYTIEPTFAALIREAEATGFEIFGYEPNFEESQDMDAADRFALRESGQAENIQARIEAAPEDARFVIFAGWSHIAEQPTPAPGGPGKWMAARFKENTGIDPLTVDLTSCVYESEDPEDWQGRMLLAADGTPLVFGRDAHAFDAQIRLPVPPRNHPVAAGFYRQTLGQAVRVPDELRPGEQPVLVQARKLPMLDDSAAHDRVLLHPGEDLPLYLPPGEYELQSHRGDGEIIGRVRVVVETGTCPERLHGRAPAGDELSILAPATDGDGLQIQVIDDHRLAVVSRRSDLPELTINGGAAKFSWHEVNGFGAVLLEQCGLARAAMSLMAGSESLEWVAPGFFESRPESAIQAASLRTFSLSSQALGRDREVYLVTPEGWDGAAGDPLLISGDALAASTFGAIVEILAANGQIRPVAFASVRFGEGMLDGTRVPVRSAEYHLPGGSAPDVERATYAAHEKFFFDDFLPFVIEELGGEIGPIYTFGISASASFALEQALMRGDLIAGVIAASPPIHSRTRELAN
ncbi:MAG: hypothetical protein ACNA7E_11055, partial [Wenzhouxiangellaceae bacterium]